MFSVRREINANSSNLYFILLKNRLFYFLAALLEQRLMFINTGLIMDAITQSSSLYYAHHDEFSLY